MNIISIGIQNYRSIKKLIIPIEPLEDGTRTFGLIGVNEAGKSSILKALALTNVNNKPNLKDFHNTTLPIVVSVKYDLNEEYKNLLVEYFLENTPEGVEKIGNFNSVVITYLYINNNSEITSNTLMRVYDVDDGFYDISPEIAPLSYMRLPVFWTAEAKYLISEPINIDSFSADPENISIPLKNCFKLAGYEDIPSAISTLIESTDTELMQDRLGRSVTEHINKVWPGHPVRISFLISDRKINFHIKDEGSLAKAKTMTQRSDGFKQFISFLLTISAENKKEQLKNRILLIDEPETHLHPQAQQYFLNELKDISKKELNNLVFLLLTQHS